MKLPGISIFDMGTNATTFVASSVPSYNVHVKQKKKKKKARESRRFCALFENISAFDDLQVRQFTGSPHRELFVLSSYLRNRNMCLQPRYALYISNTVARPVTMEDQTLEIAGGHSQTLPGRF